MDPFAGRRLAAISSEDLLALIKRGDSESINLEYKRDLDIDDNNRDRQRNKRQEFLKDVAAFANSSGGLLIYGIEEEKDSNDHPTGDPNELCGIDCQNIGQLKLSIESIISSGIDEAPYGHIEVEGVPLKNGKFAVLIRVPASLRAPHMVKLGGEQRFYRRVNTRSEPMTASQIRDVVLQSASIEERITNQLAERRNVLRKRFSGFPFFVFHLIPLLNNSRRLDITRPATIARLNEIRCFSKHGLSRYEKGNHLLEGYEVAVRANDDLWAYALVQRDGVAEFLNVYTLRGNDGLFRYEYVEQEVHESLSSGMALYKDLLPLPVAVALSLENVAQLCWPDWSRHYDVHKGKPFTSDNITPDPIVISELRDDYRPLMKPIWDVIWNAGGQPRCKGYDENNRYIGYGPSQ